MTENNLSTAKDRIKYLIDLEGISKREFYRRTGMANGVLDQKTGLSEDNMVKFFSKYPEICPTWVITGTGHTHKKTTSLVDTENQQTKANNGKQHSRKNHSIPFFRTLIDPNGKVIDIASSTPENYITNIPETYRSDAFIAVHGYSFLPNIKEGSVIGIRTVLHLEYLAPQHKYLVITDDDMLICRILPQDEKQLIKCIDSNNEEYLLPKKYIKKLFRITCAINPE